MNERKLSASILVDYDRWLRQEERADATREKYLRSIRECDLTQIVLDDLCRVAHFARMKERQFAAHINQKNSAELRQEMNRVLRELDAMKKRSAELSKLFKRLYEDNISGKINDSRFEKLSADYENEQAELTEKMQLLEQEIAQQEEEADSIEQFILRAKKYPNLQELTPAVLHNLVNRVYVSAPDKSSGQRVQDVHISLACIGFLPESIIAEMLTHAAKSRTA